MQEGRWLDKKSLCLLGLLIVVAFVVTADQVQRDGARQMARRPPSDTLQTSEPSSTERKTTDELAKVTAEPHRMDANVFAACGASGLILIDEAETSEKASSDKELLSSIKPLSQLGKVTLKPVQIGRAHV